MSVYEGLSAEFPRDAISWRAQSVTQDGTKAMALAYIDARDVMDRLDSVVGFENWQDRYEFHGPRTICYLSLRIDGEWVTKADGAGDSDVESEKGAISDALKRAAVKWGVGRYLYHLPSPWVEVEQRGRSSVIKQSEYAKLERLLASDAKATADAAPPSAVVQTATASLAMCRDEADLKEWSASNGEMISGLSEVEKQGVRKAYAARQTAIKSATNPFEQKAA